jgi:hypothetical protein
MLVAGQYFCMEKIEAGVAGEVATEESPAAVCALDRPVSVEAGGASVRLHAYSSVLIPAAAGSYAIRPAEEGDGGTALIAYVPVSQEATRADLAQRGFGRDEIDAFLAQFAPAEDPGRAADSAGG